MNRCDIFLDRLRSRGYRITPQREMVVQALVNNDEHMTAEQVYEQVEHRTRSINIATIYRILDMLVIEGLASRSYLSNGQIIFTTDHHGPHVHLVCKHCGSILNVEQNQVIASLLEQLKLSYDFEADLQHISISGLCGYCQKKSSQEV